MVNVLYVCHDIGYHRSSFTISMKNRLHEHGIISIYCSVILKAACANIVSTLKSTLVSNDCQCA